MKNRVVCVSAMVLTGFASLLTGCNSNAVPQPAPIVDGNAANDPANANLLPVSTGASQYAVAQYPAEPVSGRVRYASVQQSAPAQPGNYGAGNSQQNEAYRYNTQQPQTTQQPYTQGGADQQYAGSQPGSDQQISAQEYDQYASLLDPTVPEATQPPPPLPDDYQQPSAPGPNYLWTPGYWDYAPAGYYYVPGVWVGAPYAGALWTPGWWGYYGHGYRWHHGYWGEHVGYYGGINYGFGFVGFGYQGGYWRDNSFYYNRAVNHVDPRVVNNYVYQRNVTVVNNTFINNSRTSYYGGPNGLHRAPAPQEFAALHERRTPPMQVQLANRQAAASNRQQFFNTNNGRPQMLFAARPAEPDRNIAPPENRSSQGQGFNGARPGGFQGGVANRPQEQQREAQQGNAQGNQQRQQYDQQRLAEQQREQAAQTNLQRRQLDGKRQEIVAAPGQQGVDTQRPVGQGQRSGYDNGRQQEQLNTGQRQPSDAQRQQQAQDQQRIQQQQRQQVQDQQRIQQQQQQLEAQRQQQANAAREQQAAQQRQQMIQQQSNQQRPAPVVPHVDTPRPAAPPAQHYEAPRAAPAPAAAPHNDSRPEAGGQHH